MSRYWWLVGAAAAFLYLVRPILPPFILGTVLAYLLDPAVGALGRWLRVPRAAAVVAVYLVFLGVLAGLAAALIPLLGIEARELARHGPEILEAAFLRLFGRPKLDLFGRPLTARALGLYLVRTAEAFAGEPREALQVAAALLETILGSFLTLVVAFYLLLDGRRLAAGALALLPGEVRTEVSALARPVHRVFGRYLRGQLFLVLFMSAVTYMVLKFGFNLRYALALALLTGLLEVIPFVGPAAAAVLAAGLGLAQHGPEAAAAILLIPRSTTTGRPGGDSHSARASGWTSPGLDPLCDSMRRGLGRAFRGGTGGPGGRGHQGGRRPLPDRRDLRRRHQQNRPPGGGYHPGRHAPRPETAQTIPAPGSHHQEGLPSGDPG